MKRTVKAWACLHESGTFRVVAGAYPTFSSGRSALASRWTDERVVPVTITYTVPARRTRTGRAKKGGRK